MRLFTLVLILILAVLSACVSTTDVEAPDQVDPNSSFQAVGTFLIHESYGFSWGGRNGYLGVLIPIGWVADNVTYEKVQGSQPNSGKMFYNADVVLACESHYPSAPSDTWIGFASDSGYPYEIGDIYEVTVIIRTDSTIGLVDIAFLGMGYDPMGAYRWEGDPCSTTVEVVGLNLEQSTWGTVKSEFGSL